MLVRILEPETFIASKAVNSFQTYEFMRTLPGQVVTPARHEHRLPEEPEEDEGREADQDRPLVAGRRTQGLVLTPQNVLDVAFGLII